MSTPILHIDAITFDLTGAVTSSGTPTLPHAHPSSVDWAKSGRSGTSQAIAWSCVDLLAHTLSVSVSFSILTDQTSDIDIRATSTRSDLELGSRRLVKPVAGSYVLTWILSLKKLAAEGVRRLDWQWTWSVGQTGGSWTRLELSHHTAFVLLSAPKAPWSLPAAAGTTAPWFEVLDLACDWAAGSRTNDEATAAITQRLFELGGLPITIRGLRESIKYDPLNTSRFVAGSAFLTARFIAMARLRRDARSSTFNCLDAAFAVATFAAALGVPMGISIICGEQPFRTNPVRAAGERAFAQWDFNYHSIAAWPRGATSLAWDASLMLDLDAAPHISTTATHGLALALPTGPTGYERQLTRATVRLSAPQTTNVDGTGRLFPVLPFCPEKDTVVGKWLAGAPWTTGPDGAMFIAQLTTELQGWVSPADPGSYFADGTSTIGTDVFEEIEAGRSTDDSGRVQVTLWTARTRRAALRLFIDVAITAAGASEKSNAIGDVALLFSGNTEILVLKGRTVGRLRGEWANQAASTLFAQQLFPHRTT